MSIQPKILVTGAGGQLGRRVVHHLLKSVPAAQVTPLVRNSAAASSFSALGVEARIGDYAQPETLERAFAGVQRLLLISSNAMGQRGTQHRNVIDAAKRAGVTTIVYTSILHADTSPLGLADEHRETEADLQASGIPYVILRNGWYTENYTASIPAALAHSVFLGSAGEGRIASAARDDYAEAAAVVLTATDVGAGRIYELAGDLAYTLAQFAEELSRQTGKSIPYKNLSEADYEAVLVGAGLPAPLAALLADSHTGASKGALEDKGRQLSTLIQRPTTRLGASIATALAN